MPGRLVGPDARIYKGRDIGEVPAPPANIIEALKSRCELANDGRIVAETHRLVLLPATIYGEPLTLKLLRELASEAGKRRDPSFSDQEWYNNLAFANRPLKKSEWVLEYEGVAPGTFDKTDSEQVAVVDKLTNYKTASVLEHVGTLVLQDLENGERMYSAINGRCEERSASGARVAAGDFHAGGLDIYGYGDNYRRDGLGRAVVRKFGAP
jgi:hypothetical protein